MNIMPPSNDYQNRAVGTEREEEPTYITGHLTVRKLYFPHLVFQSLALLFYL